MLSRPNIRRYKNNAYTFRFQRWVGAHCSLFNTFILFFIIHIEHSLIVSWLRFLV